MLVNIDASPLICLIQATCTPKVSEPAYNSHDCWAVVDTPTAVEIACKILLCIEDDPFPMEDDDMFERIDMIIQESIRPVLKADSGDIALVDVSDGVVTITLEKPRVPTAFSSFLMTFKVRKGCSCGRCAVPVVAVKEGVLKRLREEVPEVREVVVAKG